MENNKSKYNSLAEWKKAEPRAYDIARSRNLLRMICEKFNWILPIVYWTKNDCIIDALLYNTRSDWKNKSNGSYQKAVKLKCLAECTKHMYLTQKPTGYWTIKENVLAEAIKYKTRIEWLDNSSTSYQSAHKHGWIEECTKHMLNKIQKIKGYWTKERCIEKARKYKTRREWVLKSSGSFSAAKKNNWLEVCSNHMLKNGLSNRKPTGYWTKEKCVKEAKKFNTRNDWRLKSYGSWKTCLKNKWIEECTKHMIIFNKPTRYWTKEKCVKEAKNYKIIKDWRKLNGGSYQSAHKHGWIEECTKHMVKVVKKSRYTLEICQKDAFKYNTKMEWKNRDGKTYSAAIKYKWLDKCTKHMKKCKKK